MSRPLPDARPTPPASAPAPARDHRHDDPAWRLATAFVLSRRSPHTRRAYARDIRDFYTWCAQAGLDPLDVPMARFRRRFAAGGG